MLNERELTKIASAELVRAYGKEYLQNTYEGSIIATGMVTDDLFMFFLGIKGQDKLPDREADDHGWVVSGTIYINANSGEVVSSECTKE